METVVEAIEQAVGASIGLFEGKNMGRMAVKLSLNRRLALGGILFSVARLFRRANLSGRSK